MGPALKENFPEVEKQVRINPVSSQLHEGDAKFNERVIIVGQDFFDVFDFEILTGDRDALHKKIGLVIRNALLKSILEKLTRSTK
jgi:hypothetical protein